MANENISNDIFCIFASCFLRLSLCRVCANLTPLQNLRQVNILWVGKREASRSSSLQSLPLLSQFKTFSQLSILQTLQSNMLYPHNETSKLHTSMALHNIIVFCKKTLRQSGIKLQISFNDIHSVRREGKLRTFEFVNEKYSLVCGV